MAPATSLAILNNVNNMKKLLTTRVTAIMLTLNIVLAAVVMLATPPLVSAQTGDMSGNGGAVFCRNGARDYSNFASSIISYDGFVEYWKDIIERYNSNICVYNDIESLLNRINKTRTLIRKAFYTCDASASKLAHTYDELEAELFFLRKYVTFSSNGQTWFKTDDEIKNAFMAYVVDNKKIFTSRELAEPLFQRILAKYKSRQDAYTNCKDPTWTNLIDKWNEFVDTAGGLGEVKKSGATLDAAAADLNKPIAFGSLFEFKINGLPPEESLNEILKELKKNTPQGVTFEEAKLAADQEKNRYQGALERLTYLNQYKVQYQNVSGELLKEIINRLGQLQDIIMDTFPFIGQAKQCTKGLLDKTCG